MWNLSLLTNIMVSWFSNSHQPFIFKLCCANQLIWSRSRHQRHQKQEYICGRIVFWDIPAFKQVKDSGLGFLSYGRSTVWLLDLISESQLECKEREISARLWRHFKPLEEEDGLLVLSPGTDWRTWQEIKEKGHEMPQGAGSKVWCHPRLPCPQHDQPGRTMWAVIIYSPKDISEILAPYETTANPHLPLNYLP